MTTVVVVMEEEELSALSWEIFVLVLDRILNLAVLKCPVYRKEA